MDLDMHSVSDLWLCKAASQLSREFTSVTSLDLFFCASVIAIMIVSGCAGYMSGSGR